MFKNSLDTSPPDPQLYHASHDDCALHLQQHCLKALFTITIDRHPKSLNSISILSHKFIIRYLAVGIISLTHIPLCACTSYIVDIHCL